jgi:hypothetical protein
VEDLVRKYPDLKIYIHTWNKIQSSRSYRKMENINTPVTRGMISNYFGKKVMANVKHVMIEDDESVVYYGDIEGNIPNTGCPKIAWKNMWAGKYSVLKYVYDNESNKDETTINMRVDYFLNPLVENKRSVLEFIKDSINTDEIKFTKNSTIYRSSWMNVGCDNIYCGRLINVYSLSYYFNFLLDKIIYNNKDELLKRSLNNSLVTHESLVFLERNYVIPTKLEYTIINPTKTGGTCLNKIINRMIKNLYNNYNSYEIYCQYSSSTMKNPIITIRHPIPRFLSMYKYWKNGSELAVDQKHQQLIHDSTVKDFINMIKTNNANLNNTYRWDVHYKPMTWFIGDAKLSDLIVLVNDDETSILVKLKQFFAYAGENPELITDTNERINVSGGDGDELLLLDYDDICFIHDWYKDDIDLYEKALNSPELFKKVF